MLAQEIAAALGLTQRYVRSLAKSASHHYKVYLVAKRDGGQRQIYHPAKQLKGVQRWLLRETLQRLPIHGNAMAYVPGRSTLINAAAHASSRYLLRMDLEDFFPSLKAADLKTFIRRHPVVFSSWDDADIELFCNLVCRNGTLPIGAPSSPALSNALCFQLDEQLTSLATCYASTYTRYADDLFFSTQKREVLRHIESATPGILAGLDCPADLRLNPRKTRHSSKRGARRVTGITLGSDGSTHVGRAIKRRIRSNIFRLGTLSPIERTALAGWIAYASGIEPDFLNSLIAKYGLPLVRKAQGLDSASP